MEFSLDSLQPKERASFALRALYEAAGCRKYHMGRFEEYGLYQENRSFLSSEQVITFTDLDGRLLALKPDVTLSIAKTAQPAPGETLRYYYHENVYRPSAESHTFQEISQMGLEMLGAVGEAQVQQAVRLAAQSLAQLGAAWVLEVSHMGYLFGLFDALGVPENARPGLLEKLREKNAHELRRAAQAAGLDAAGADALTGLLELSGSCEETLAKAESACRNDRMRAAAAELRALVATFYADDNHDHMVFPGMVYISHPTEYGTLYTKAELEALHAVCQEYKMPLFLDGARLGYGLAAEGTDVTLADLARLTDVFYIGGTKVGALCGEAVVFPHGAPAHFMTMVKQQGALLAKGRLLGIQFDVLFTDGLYFSISKNAIATANRLKAGFAAKGYRFFMDSPTNQIFLVLENTQLAALEGKAKFGFWEKFDDTHTVVRIATSWATHMDEVEALIDLM